MFISELHIQGYKRLRDVTLPLGPLTVLIGPNASGKSSALEVLDLLGRSAEGRLSERLVELGGIDGVISRGTKSDHVRVDLTCPAISDVGDITYGCTVAAVGRGDHILDEEELAPTRSPGEPMVIGGEQCAAVQHSGSDSVTWQKTDQGETALSEAPPAGDLVQRFRTCLSHVRLYRPIDVTPRSPARLPQQIRPIRLPLPNGDGLLAALQTKRSRDPGMFDFLRDALRSAYPGFEDMDLEPVAAGQVVLTWRERGQQFYGNELSDGALRFLWLATLLSNSEPPPLMMVDEPEVSLHPTLLMILRDLLREASTHGQVLVATQSPELVSWLDPRELAVVDLDDEGWTTVTSGAKLDVASWLEDYTLGQLWTKGVIGGRP